MNLTERDRVTILMMRGYGDRVRSYQEVANLFNATFPEHPPISKSTVYRTVDRFERMGLIKDKPRSGRTNSATNHEKALDDLQSVIETPHTPLSKLAETHGVSTKSVHRILKMYHYHPYKMILVQQLTEDDCDRRVEFCDTMMNRFDANANSSTGPAFLTKRPWN